MWLLFVELSMHMLLSTEIMCALYSFCGPHHCRSVEQGCSLFCLEDLMWVDRMRMTGWGKGNWKPSNHTLSPVVTRVLPKVDILSFYRFMYAIMNNIHCFIHEPVIRIQYTIAWHILVPPHPPTSCFHRIGPHIEFTLCAYIKSL